MVRVSLVIVALGVVSVACAGYYKVTYSGGEVGITGPSGVEWIMPYAGSPIGWGGGSVAGEEPPPGGGVVGALPGSVVCRDPVTITFTWIGSRGEERPPGLLLHKVALATWAGQSGSASNGLGDPEVIDPDGMHGSSNGEQWEYIANPPETF